LAHKGIVRCNGEPFGVSGRLSQGVDGARRGSSDSDSDPGRRGSSGSGGDEGGDDDGDDWNSDRGDQLSGVDEPRRSPSPRGLSAPCSCSGPLPCPCSSEDGLGWSSSSGPASRGPMTSVTTRARSML
jgi:hypothetical protein